MQIHCGTGGDIVGFIRARHRRTKRKKTERKPGPEPKTDMMEGCNGGLSDANTPSPPASLTVSRSVSLVHTSLRGVLHRGPTQSSQSTAARLCHSVCLPSNAAVPAKLDHNQDLHMARAHYCNHNVFATSLSNLCESDLGSQVMSCSSA